MGIPSFAFGAGFEAKTPQEAARARAVYEALAARGGAPQNVGEGLNRVGEALLARSMLDRATAGEEAGQKRVADLMAGLGDGADQTELMAVLADPWAAENPATSMVAQTMLQREMKKGEPSWQTFESGGDVYRWNENDPNATPGMFFDGPDAPIPAPEVTEDYDPETGRKRKQQWNASTGTWDAMGGVAAPDDPLVTVNTGDNSGAFKKKADETAAVRMNDVVASGQAAQAFVGDMKALTEIGRNIETGKGAEIATALGPYAESLGVKIEGLGEMQAFDAIVSRLAPQMRVPGSGASSDFDAKQFLKSLPGLGKSEEGNAIIIQTFEAVQQAKIAAAEIAGRALNGEITWQEADKQIAAIGDPFEAFNAYKKQAGGGGLKRITSDAEFDALPSGTEFIDPDGKRRRKP